MAYKDKDRQREAQRDWVRQKREGSTDEGSTKQGSTEQGVTVVLSGGNMDIETLAMVDAGCGDKLTHGQPERTAQGNIRVSKPGDDDYVPQCETTRAFIEGRDKCPETGKRGKDIKTFEDLPPDVQKSINMMSDTAEMHTYNTALAIKANRTAIAINYQHLFPESYGLGAIELMRAEADYNGPT